MEDLNARISQRFLALVFLVLIVTYLLSSLVSYRVFRPQAEEIKEIVSQVSVDSQELSISAYEISKREPARYLAKVQDASGQTYYIKNNYQDLAYQILASAIILILAFLATNYLMRYYRGYMRNKALRPVFRLSEAITGILSGTSKEGDLNKVVDEIKPLFHNDVSSERLENSISKLFIAETNRREFTANVTHELKTPLTSINGYAEMIASGLTNDEDTRKFANIILHEGNRLLEMIEEILRLSQYESQSRSDIDLKRLDLGELVGQICYDMQTYAKTKGIELSYNVQSVFCNVDPNMVYEMVTNLISNSIKYNEPPGKVRVSVANKYPYATISVKDDGIGIAEENLDRIFERFYMVNRSSSKTSGTGLGLSLVKHIVENHKGNIEVKSQLGQGSEFIVKLPMATDEEIKELEAETSNLEEQ